VDLAAWLDMCVCVYVEEDVWRLEDGVFYTTGQYEWDFF
jgi:hypothetical protein